TKRIFPNPVLDAFRGVDLILHAGDIYIPSALDELQQVAPVLAARGDDDMLRDPRVKERHVVEVGTLKVGLTHVFEGLHLYWGLDKAMETEFGGPVNIIVFGHTHSPLVKRDNSVMLVNPGSTLLPHYQPKLGSVGILDIDDGRISISLVELK
ncbi:MAG: YfcE family phosphodiesterase, partial [Dehalococcoidia bacterium]|nr:YfcE family phosphodiesterase [Dehalococcoidia bacterium]